MTLPRCWEIIDCGRQKGGSKVDELGECIVSKEGFGLLCWAVAGTLCEGEVAGTAAQKKGDCLQCEVYVLRHGFSDDEYARISNSDIGHAAGLLSEHDGAYARIRPALRSDGPFSVETAAGRDIWRQIVTAIDEAERRCTPEDRGPDD